MSLRRRGEKKAVSGLETISCQKQIIYFHPPASNACRQEQGPAMAVA